MIMPCFYLLAPEDANEFHGGETGAYLLSCPTMPHSATPDTPALRGPTNLSQLLMARFLWPGDAAIDATCGNGHDTLCLARLVGPNGRIWAFDIQEQAIGATSRRLTEAGMAERVKLILAGHESMTEHVPTQVRGVMFNLGYCPGGDRAIITRPETTRAALDQARELLLPGGILAITVYPGHDGGEKEEVMLREWSSSLPQRSFHAWRMGQVNTPPGAPYLFLIQKAV
jgi:predicted methyltransferase